jgi:high-affinity iron transporter
MSGVFLQAVGILIREGLEAMLVIAALAVYLSKVGARARLPALYGGAALAVLASIAAAWIFERFYGGAHDDLMGGVIILVAAAVMLYVSGWLLLRQDPHAWQGYLKQKADQLLHKRNVRRQRQRRMRDPIGQAYQDDQQQ